MNRLAISLLALAAALPAHALDVTVQAPVSAVTVFPDGAELTRRATAELPAGQHRIFLPYAGLDDLSALPRIAASEGVSVGTLGFRRDVGIDREALFTEEQAAAWAEVKRLEAELDAISDARSETAGKAHALRAQLAFFGAADLGDAPDPADLLPFAAALAEGVAEAEAGLVAIQAELRPIDERFEEGVTRLDAAEAAFERLSPPADRVNMVVVEVDHAEAGPVVLELTEATDFARWEMDYDIDLDRDTGEVAVQRKVIVMQNTDEIWSDVSLTLSTARPGEETGPTQIYPDLAYIEEPLDRQPVGAGVAGLEDRMMMASPMAEKAMAPANMTSAEVQFDGLALSYAYPGLVTIATNEASEIALDRLAFDAEEMLWASPRHDETAFTMARFTNTSGEPILPGMANILRDGHLVGREAIEMIPAGAETEMGFGPFEGIRLKTIFETNAEGDTGLITRSNTREQRITFTVENLTNSPRTLRVFFPLTFSEQEDLRVRVSAQPAPDETDIDRERGVSAWDMELMTAEKKEVNITVSLDWPEGMEFYWHP